MPPSISGTTLPPRTIAPKPTLNLCAKVYVDRGQDYLNTCGGALAPIPPFGTVSKSDLHTDFPFLSTASYNLTQSAKLDISNVTHQRLTSPQYGSILIVWPDLNISDGSIFVRAEADSTAMSQVLGVSYPTPMSAVVYVEVETVLVYYDTVLDNTKVLVAGITLTVGLTSDEVKPYQITIALERPIVLVPRKVFQIDETNKFTSNLGGMISITVGSVALPTATGQLFVSLALMRIAQCDDDPLNGEPFDLPVHPLYFGLGEGDARYARGAFLGNLLIIPLVWSALGYFIVPFVLSYFKKESIEAGRDFVG